MVKNYNSDTPEVELSSEERLTSIKNRISAIQEKKASAEAENKLLKRQYSEGIAELKTMGIDNVKDLPKTIAALEEELKTLLGTVEEGITDIESKLEILGVTDE